MNKAKILGLVELAFDLTRFGFYKVSINISPGKSVILSIGKPSEEEFVYFEVTCNRWGQRFEEDLQLMEEKLLYYRRLSAELPECFGSDPNPQEEAENGCSDCTFWVDCRQNSKRIPK